MGKFCMNCGNPLSDNARFCTKCGAKTEAVPAVTPPAAPAPIPAPTPKAPMAPAPVAAGEEEMRATGFMAAPSLGGPVTAPAPAPAPVAPAPEPVVVAAPIPAPEPVMPAPEPFRCVMTPPPSATAPVAPAPGPVYAAPLTPASVAPVPPVAAAPAPKKPKKKGKAWLVILIILLLVGTIATALLLWQPWNLDDDDDDDEKSSNSDKDDDDEDDKDDEDEDDEDDKNDEEDKDDGTGAPHESKPPHDTPSDDNTPNETTPGNITNAGEKVEVLRCLAQKYGFFTVEFEYQNNLFAGIADSKGQIFYYTDDYYSGHSFFFDFNIIGPTAGYITDPNNSDVICTLINTSGLQKTFTKIDFDSIVGGDGDYLLVYKNTGNISKEEHSYGVINSQGNWEIPLTPGAKLPNLSDYISKSFVYAGEMTFIMQYYQFYDRCVVFDCANNRTIGFNDVLISSQSVTNGKFIVNRSGGGSYSIPYGSNENKRLNMGVSYMFHTDGSYEEITPVSFAFDQIAIYEEAGYYQIWDLSTGAVSKYDDYAAQSISNFSFIGKNGLVTINGQDGKRYFTVINEKGEAYFEPRQVLGLPEFCGDRTVYQTENGYYVMIDNNGNMIISEDEKCVYLKLNGNAVGKTTEADGLDVSVYEFIASICDENGKKCDYTLVK